MKVTPRATAALAMLSSLVIAAGLAAPAGHATTTNPATYTTSLEASQSPAPAASVTERKKTRVYGPWLKVGKKKRGEVRVEAKCPSGMRPRDAEVNFAGDKGSPARVKSLELGVTGDLTRSYAKLVVKPGPKFKVRAEAICK